MSDAKKRIVETTADLMQRNGYCATGLKDIIRESGTPKGSLYHYFPGGKEEIARAALQSSAQSFGEALQTCIDIEGSVAKGFARFIREYARSFEASGFEKGCPVTTVALETASNSEQLQQMLQAIFHNWCQILIDHLVSTGWDETEARNMAIFVMSSFNGALSMSRAAQRIEPMEIVANQIEELLAQKGA